MRLDYYKFSDHDFLYHDLLVFAFSLRSTARIVIYCRSGKRANVAKERLISMGYNEKNLLNAGGLADVLAILGQGERLL